MRNLYEDDKLKRTKELKRAEEKDKKDFKKQNADKDMLVPLEYLYGIVTTVENESELMEYYRNIKNNRDEQGVTESVYTFSNEDLQGLFEKLNVNNKRVLTVGSSGDQAIYALFNGAKEVDLIDGNILTKMYVELKLAAIKTFDLKTFNKFLAGLTNGDINVAILYSKISHLLPKDAQAFWDSIYLNFDEDKLDLLSLLFTKDSYLDLDLYNKEENFNKLKEFLNNNDYKLNYIFAEFKDFPKQAKGKYDLILLSNVKDYIETTKEFFKTAKVLYDKNLNENGLIQVQTAINVIYGFDDFLKKTNAKKFVVKGAGLHGSNAVFVKKPKEKEMNK